MHVRTRAWRNVILAFALATLALPLATQGSTPASAQIVGATNNPSAIASVGAATPGLAFNVLGTNHTVTFTCANAFALYPAGTTRDQLSRSLGCRDVLVSVQNASAGGTSSVVGTQCRVRTIFHETPTANGGDCGDLTPTQTAATTINPGSPGVYTVTFAGLVPAYCPIPTPDSGCSRNGTTILGYLCPAGTGPLQLDDVGNPGCGFAVTAQKKYVEITSLTSTTTGTCGGLVVYSEGLKRFLGPSCVVTFVASGTLILKPTPSCSVEPPNGTPAPAEFGPGATYICNGNFLGVTGITATGINSNTVAPTSATCTNVAATGLPGVAVLSGNTFTCPSGTFTKVDGTVCPGSFSPLPTPNGTSTTVTCGVPNNLTGLPVTITSNNVGLATGTTFASGGSVFCVGGAAPTNVVTGTPVTLCATNFGSASVSGCVGQDFINTQPTVCSTAINFNFTLPSTGRTVPYVRWAGEKVVLTKCFGGAGLMGGALVEFVLKGNNPGLNATLLPTEFVGPGAIGAGGAVPNSTTVFGVTDARGCASVILYSDGEGAAFVDAALYSPAPFVGGTTSPIINEHAFEVFYLKFNNVSLENIAPAGSASAPTFSSATAISPELSFLAGTAGFPLSASAPTSISLPTLPGTGNAAGGTFPIPLCGVDLVRAMVHGYFEMSGDPSGRPATAVTIPGAPAGASGSYVLPAGRWVLPEDWPVLATFAGFVAPGSPLTGAGNPASVFAWDLNSGFAFDPNTEPAVLCTGPATAPSLSVNGQAPIGPITSYSTGPCYGADVLGNVNGFIYSTAPAGPNCTGGLTVGIGPFDATQSCTNPYPLAYSPAGSGQITTGGTCTAATFCNAPLGPNSTYLPNGFLSQWDAPMPPAQVTFGITSGPGFLDQVNKTAVYNFKVNTAGGTTTPLYYNPFYAEAIPASPLIPPITNNGGYLWDSWGFRGGTPVLTTSTIGGGTTVSTTLTAGTGDICATAGDTAVLTVANIAGLSAGSRVTLIIPGRLNPIVGVAITLVTPATAGATTGPGTITISCVALFTADVSSLPSGTTVTTTITTTGVAFIRTPQGQPDCGPNNTVTLIVGNTTGIVAGGTVTLTLPPVSLLAYILPTQDQITVANVPVTAVTATTITVSCAPLLAAGDLFVVPAGTTVSPNGFLVTLGGGAPALTTGQSVTVECPNGAFAQTTVTIGAGGVIILASAPILAACGPLPLPAGTLIEIGPTRSAAVGPGGEILGKPSNPYPFWQWLPNPPTSVTGNTTATVYSDNHGEAMVSLETGFTSQTVAAVGGTCPAGYTLVSSTSTCILPLEALGAFGLQNVQAAIKAGAGTCLATTSTGTASAVAGATIGANGPAPGQICVNNLGRLEFGAGAGLGTTTLQAVADYPYTRGEHPQISSGTLGKVFTSAFNKSVTVGPAVPGQVAGITNYTVTITARDVCGRPLTGEPIQVYTFGNPGAVVLSPLGANTISLSQSSAVVTVSPVTGTATLALEVLGQLLGNGGATIKVIFPVEGIERFVTVIAPTTPTTTTTVLYAPGYQQVGGPVGSNFGVAEAVFSYSPSTNAYTNATSSAPNLSSAAPACTGYWAYFAAPAAVNLPSTSKAGDTAACTLAPGWNLIGNPFASAASLPAGTTAYHWNGTSYDTVGLIPTGGAVWIYNGTTASSTVTLTAT